MKKKLLIVISDNFMYRNYIETSIFSLLNNKYKCSYIFDENIKNKNLLKYSSSFKFGYSKKKNDKYKNYYLSRIFTNLSNSSTYNLATKIFLSYNKWIDHESENIFKSITLFPIRVLLFLRNYLKYYYLKLGIFKLFRKYFEDRISVDESLENKIINIKPDLIILPTKASDTYYFDLKKISDKHKIDLLYLIDNWDNVSAKSVIFSNQYYGVWGQQSYEQVKKIHKISLKSIFILGSPRFENFFRLRDTSIKRHYKNKYILFLENTYPREIISLKFLDKIVNTFKNFNDYKIIYRPHPWRKSKELIKIKNYKNVIIDKQLSQAYKKKDFSFKSQPDLNYYPSLIKNAEFIIAGPTTMVIESLIFRKKILLLAFKESSHPYSPHNLYKLYEHFKGINKFKNIFLNKSLNNLEKDIKRLYFKKKLNYNYIDTYRNYFLYRDKKGYKLRLSKIIDKIINNKNVQK